MSGEVTDDTSMVILHESSMDYNLHVVEASKFAKNYSQHGVELEDKSPRLQELVSSPPGVYVVTACGPTSRILMYVPFQDSLVTTKLRGASILLQAALLAKTDVDSSLCPGVPTRTRLQS